MKLKTLLYLTAAASLCLLVSCQKEASVAAPGEPKEIVLSLAGDDLGLEVSTKASATEISAVPGSLYLMIKNGAATKTASSSKTVSGGKIATGLYQTATATNYSYYLSNVNITAGSSANAGTIAAVNTTDVIAGYAAATTSTTPTVKLEHVFARTGTISLAAPSGYTISGTTFKISSNETNTGTAGTYSLSDKTWSSTTKLTTATALDSSSDLYLIPGTYTIACTYTLTKGDYVQTFTKSATVTLAAGKKCNISGTAPTGNATEINLTVSLTPWETQGVSMTF